MTQLQTFPLTHFKYVHVKTNFQSVDGLFINFHTQCILVKYLWLQLDKEMEQFLAQ